MSNDGRATCGDDGESSSPSGTAVPSQTSTPFPASSNQDWDSWDDMIANERSSPGTAVLSQTLTPLPARGNQDLDSWGQNTWWGDTIANEPSLPGSAVPSQTPTRFPAMGLNNSWGDITHSKPSSPGTVVPSQTPTLFPARSYQGWDQWGHNISWIKKISRGDIVTNEPSSPNMALPTQTPIRFPARSNLGWDWWGDCVSDESMTPVTAASDPFMPAELQSCNIYDEPCTDFLLDNTWTDFLLDNTSPPLDPVGYSPPPAAYERDRTENFYKTKNIEFLGRPARIILQNNNGPCPLIAICNVLLLRDPNVFGLIGPKIRHDDLIARLEERIIEIYHEVEGKDESSGENGKWNMCDALRILPSLREGLNVNLRFRKIDDIEVTPECPIFDVLDIGLYHGWIVDPQDTETVAAIGEKTYDALMVDTIGVPSPRISENGSDSIVSIQGQEKGAGDREEERELASVLALSRNEMFSSSNVKIESDVDCCNLSPGLEKSEAATCTNFLSFSERKELLETSRLEVNEPVYEGEHCNNMHNSENPVSEDKAPINEVEIIHAEKQLIKNFLQSNASQLTIHGLYCLQEGLKERELCVFYRNNHFNTMVKLNGELYILAADEGYIDQPDLVWEKILGIRGESVFMTGVFTEFGAVGPSTLLRV